MKMSITSRIFAEADFILKSNGTVRSVAKIFGVSKSTVHNDLSKKLKRLNLSLYQKVNNLLKFNLAERHIRGGEATKKKYKTPTGFKLVKKDGFGKSRNTRDVGRYKRLRNAYIYIIKDR